MKALSRIIDDKWLERIAAVQGIVVILLIVSDPASSAVRLLVGRHRLDRLFCGPIGVDDNRAAVAGAG